MIETVIDKKSNRGGARAGAGRKKSLPEGARAATFMLSDDERLAVKKFIVELRQNGKKELDKDSEAQRLMQEAVTPLAESLQEIIKLYGGRGKGFRKAEEISKIISVIAFKDAVSLWEKENHGTNE